MPADYVRSVNIRAQDLADLKQKPFWDTYATNAYAQTVSAIDSYTIYDITDTIEIYNCCIRFQDMGVNWGDHVLWVFLDAFTVWTTAFNELWTHKRLNKNGIVYISYISYDFNDIILDIRANTLCKSSFKIVFQAGNNDAIPIKSWLAYGRNI